MKRTPITIIAHDQVVETDMFLIYTLQVFLTLILNFKQERKSYNPAKPQIQTWLVWQSMLKVIIVRYPTIPYRQEHIKIGVGFIQLGVIYR